MTDPLSDDWFEPSGGIHELLERHGVYCTNCGTVFLHRAVDACPTCALAEAVEELQNDPAEQALDSLLDGGEKVRKGRKRDSNDAAE